MMNRPKLYIVDSDPYGREAIMSVAADLDLTAHSSESGEQFLKYYAPEGAAIIWLDMILPGQDGLEVMGKLAGRYCSDPIVLTTGRSPLYLEWGKKFGEGHGLNIVSTLSKPVGSHEVWRTINGAIPHAVSAAQIDRALEMAIWRSTPWRSLSQA